MRTQPWTSVRYRGLEVAAPPAPATSRETTRLDIPFAPRPAPSPAAPGKGFSAAQVLSGTLTKWQFDGVDGATAPPRCLPPTEFRGLESRDEMKMTNCIPLAAPTFLANGRMVMVTSGLDNREIVSATIATDGTLSHSGSVNCGNVDSVVFAAGPNRVIFTQDGGAIVTSAIAADGRLDSPQSVKAIPGRYHLTQLSSGVFLASGEGELRSFTLDDAGNARLGASRSMDFDRASSDLPLVYGDNLIVRTPALLRTYSIHRNFELIDTKPVTPEGKGAQPGFISKDGVLGVISASGEDLWTYRIGTDGKITAGNHLAVDCSAEDSPVIFGSHLIALTGGGELQVFVLDGQAARPLPPVGRGLCMRPTITRDGVILVGDIHGDLIAYKLDNDGSLRELTRKSFGYQFLASVAYTVDGQLVVGCGNSIHTLGGGRA